MSKQFYLMKSIITKYSVFIIAVVLLATACKLDDTTISGVPLLEYFSIDEMANITGAETQIFTINANEDQEIVGANGVKVVIPQNVFKTDAGETVNGMVDIRLKEVLTKSEMVLSNKPSEADGVLLETVGTFLLEAFQGDNAINLDQPIGVELDMNASIVDPTALGIYYGNEIGESGSAANWVLDENTQVPLNAGVHSFDVDQLKWAACAKPLEVTTTHKLTVSPASINGLHDQKGYIIFDDSNTVGSLTAEGEKFVSNNYPSGKTCTVVMIAIDPIAIFVSVNPGVNLTADKNINAEFTEVTEDELISTIEALN